jgi:hypothetical protein
MTDQENIAAPRVGMQRKNVFSPDRIYRYVLWRDGLQKQRDFFTVVTGREDQYVQFIGLNPSKADETFDDPTLAKCMKFARRWGYGAVCMTNLFAWRETNPELMKQQPSPIGEINDWWLEEIARNASVIIAAWGTDGKHLNRSFAVCKLLSRFNLQCLRVNDDGSPQHPLYILDTTEPSAFPPLSVGR